MDSNDTKADVIIKDKIDPVQIVIGLNRYLGKQELMFHTNCEDPQQDTIVEVPLTIEVITQLEDFLAYARKQV